MRHLCSTLSKHHNHFCPIIHKRCPIAHPPRWNMGHLFYVQSVSNILYLWMLCCIQYHVILECSISSLSYWLSPSSTCCCLHSPGLISGGGGPPRYPGGGGPLCGPPRGGGGGSFGPGRKWGGVRRPSNGGGDLPSKCGGVLLSYGGVRRRGGGMSRISGGGPVRMGGGGERISGGRWRSNGGGGDRASPGKGRSMGCGGGGMRSRSMGGMGRSLGRNGRRSPIMGESLKEKYNAWFILMFSSFPFH